MCPCIYSDDTLPGVPVYILPGVPVYILPGVPVYIFTMLSQVSLYSTTLCQVFLYLFLRYSARCPCMYFLQYSAKFPCIYSDDTLPYVPVLILIMLCQVSLYSTTLCKVSLYLFLRYFARCPCIYFYDALPGVPVFILMILCHMSLYLF